MKTSPLVSILLTSTVLGTLSCDGDMDKAAEQPVTQTLSTTAGATPVGTDVWGLPWVKANSTQKGSCSSVVLSDHWVLTAEHCAASYYLRGDTVLMKDGNRTINVAHAFNDYGQADAALLRLSTPARGSFVYHNGLYRGTTQSLVNQTLTCFGWGPTTQNGSDQALRTISLTVNSVANNGNSFVTGDGVIGGDSGGPCFVNVGGQLYVAGIVASHDSVAHTSTFTAASAFRDWVDKVTAGDLNPKETILATNSWWSGQTSVLDPGGYSNPAQIFVLNDAVSSLRVGSMSNATIYANDNYGIPFYSTGPGSDVADLGVTAPSMNDQTSSAITSVAGCRNPGPNEVTLFSNAGWSGACDVVRASSIDDLAILSVGYGASSIRVGSNVRATLWRGTGYSSTAVAVTADVSDLNALSFNDAAQSIRVNARSCAAPGSGQVTVYTDIDYMGNCATVSADSAINLNGTFVAQISSVQVAPDARLALYDQANLVGQQLNSNVDRPFLPSFTWNDRAVSMRVRRSTNCGAPAAGQVVLWEDVVGGVPSGRCTKLGLGRFDRNSDFDLQVDTVSAIQVGTNTSLWMYDGEGFTSSSIRFVGPQTSDLTTVFGGPGSGGSWNDVASSVIVTSP